MGPEDGTPLLRRSTSTAVPMTIRLKCKLHGWGYGLCCLWSQLEAVDARGVWRCIQRGCSAFSRLSFDGVRCRSLFQCTQVYRHGIRGIRYTLDCDWKALAAVLRGPSSGLVGPACAESRTHHPAELPPVVGRRESSTVGSV